MNITSVSDPLSLLRFPVYDADGAEVGEIAGVYLDRGSGEPEWAALWLASGGVTAVPLADAELFEDNVTIPFTTRQIEGAPYQRDELARDLSEDEEEQLYRYYHEGDSPLVAARRVATEVASTAKKQTKRVASTAKGQGRAVASTAKKQTKRVASTAKGQGRAVVQNAAVQASEAKEEAARVAQEAAGQAESVLGELRNFARRRPIVFLVGTAAAGIAAGRLLRSASHQDRAAPEQEQQEEATAPSATASGGEAARRRTRTTTGGR